jgi:hypothetical protein
MNHALTSILVCITNEYYMSAQSNTINFPVFLQVIYRNTCNNTTEIMWSRPPPSCVYLSLNICFLFRSTNVYSRGPYICFPSSRLHRSVYSLHFGVCVHTGRQWTCSFSSWGNSPSGSGHLHYQGFTITLRHTPLHRTPLDEWSARRRDLYLATYNTHGIQTHNSCKRAAADPCLRPRGHQDRRTCSLQVKMMNILYKGRNTEMSALRVTVILSANGKRLWKAVCQLRNVGMSYARCQPSLPQCDWETSRVTRYRLVTATTADSMVPLSLRAESPLPRF